MCGSSEPRTLSTATPQETEIQATQLALMQQSQAQQKELEPYTLAGLGLTRDPSTGQLRYMTEDEQRSSMNPLQQGQYDIAQLQQERTLSALKGELPVDPAMEKRLTDEEGKLREYLSQTLGPDYEQSTAGIQALSNFKTQAGSLRYQAQQGQLTSGEAGLMSNLGYLGNYSTAQAQQLGTYPFQSSQLASQYGGLLQPYFQNRQMRAQLTTAMKQQQSSNYNSGMGMIGSMM